MPQDRAAAQSGSTIRVLQEVPSPSIPDNAHVLTVLISHPPGAPGYPPHRLPGGPGFGYMIDGEMLFEIEGDAPRVLRAGDAFWGPGGDVIHYQDANNRSDIPCSFVLTMLCVPGRPLREWVTREELEHRKALRVPRTRVRAPTASYDSEDAWAYEWRETTREFVLTAASAIVATDQHQQQGTISITVTGTSLSNDLLLADTGTIALTSLADRTDRHSHPMSVLPMRLDILSHLPVVCVVGHDVTEPTQLRLIIELTARNPHTDTTSVLVCEYDPVRLDPSAPLTRMVFHPRQVGQRH